MTKPKPPPPSSEPAKKRKVFLVDDHPIVRQGLAQLIDNESDLTVIGQGEDAYGALRAIRDCKPDLVLVDVSLKDSDGIELLKEIKSQSPALPVLVVSMHDESLYAERALRAGAGGYVMKQEAPATLLAAMRSVLAGKVYVSEKMSAQLIQRMVGGKKKSGGLPMDRLTDRELEIFRFIGSGKSVNNIELAGRAKERLVLVRAVHVHQFAAQRGENLEGGG